MINLATIALLIAALAIVGAISGMVYSFFWLLEYYGLDSEAQQIVAMGLFVYAMFFGLVYHMWEDGGR